MGRIALSDGEWKVMNALWKQPPKTIMQLTKELKEETDWGKNVIITMLNRLEAKGAVIHEEDVRSSFIRQSTGKIRCWRRRKGFWNAFTRGV